MTFSGEGFPQIRKNAGIFRRWRESFFYQKQPLKVFHEKSVLRNFAKFTEKHLCQSLYFNKVAGLRPATFLKKRLWYMCVLVNFAKFLRTLILKNNCEQLLWFYQKFHEVPDRNISKFHKSIRSMHIPKVYSLYIEKKHKC